MTHHRNPVLNGLSLGLLSLALSACDTAPTQVDRHFGMAVRQAQAQQTRQPDTRPCRQCAMQAQQRQTEGMPAPMPPDDARPMPEKKGHTMPMSMPMPMPMPPGMHERHHPASVDTDGASAQAAIERYQESFQTPPAPTPIFNIGLGATRSR
jgi:hypothetical protein